VDITLERWNESGMSGAAPDTRIRAMVDDHFARVWGLLRRLGVPAEALDDSAPPPLPPGLPEHRGASFDKGEAARALGRVDLTDCMAIPGPTGAGHVTVIFVDDGTVSSAVVDQGPFPGTPRGGCVAGKFHAATVPPFDGSPVRVGKSFALPNSETGLSFAAYRESP